MTMACELQHKYSPDAQRRMGHLAGEMRLNYPTRREITLRLQHWGVFLTTQGGVFHTTQRGVLPTTQGGVFPTTQGGVFPATHGGVIPTTQGGVFSTTQGGVFPTTHGGIFPTTHEGVFPTTHEGVFPTTQGGVFPTTQGGVFPTTQGGVFPTTQGGVFPTTQGGATKGLMIMENKKDQKKKYKAIRVKNTKQKNKTKDKFGEEEINEDRKIKIKQNIEIDTQIYGRQRYFSPPVGNKYSMGQI
ncbi:CaM kinase-like vesicle-associated protein-like [Homarus americanus]|uniref:CaM kinase-like vesicle-associated protein-like n=1 Tax=Homarus americanus TaxID=6706 RepID=A0A8J5TJ02_HOMAM|nr:CaM kinase-like vesicle-associated protein-like [Homarus americanus]